MESDLHGILSAVAQTNDAGEPASPAEIAAATGRPTAQVDELLRRAQGAALVGKIGQAVDCQLSPIERAREGWMLLAAGEMALGRPATTPADPSPLD